MKITKVGRDILEKHNNIKIMRIEFELESGEEILAMRNMTGLGLQIGNIVQLAISNQDPSFWSPKSFRRDYKVLDIQHDFTTTYPSTNRTDDVLDSHTVTVIVQEVEYNADGSIKEN